jgi:FtsP/CotA-like multicopper oxidase with cupredoxin domain
VKHLIRFDCWSASTSRSSATRVLVHPRETVEVGTVPLDEGRWMMHCHILEHAEAGMMTLFDVR